MSAPLRGNGRAVCDLFAVWVIPPPLGGNFVSRENAVENDRG